MRVAHLITCTVQFSLEPIQIGRRLKRGNETKPPLRLRSGQALRRLKNAKKWASSEATKVVFVSLSRLEPPPYSGRFLTQYAGRYIQIFLKAALDVSPDTFYNQELCPRNLIASSRVRTSHLPELRCPCLCASRAFRLGNRFDFPLYDAANLSSPHFMATNFFAIERFLIAP